MTRPAATATAARRGVREKKRTSPRLTAHIEYQPAGLDLSGRRVKEAYHHRPGDPGRDPDPLARRRLVRFARPVG
jgi:hypothetical protein